MTPPAPPEPAGVRGTGRPRRAPWQVAALTAAAFLALTSVASWSVARADAASEHNLLTWQTKQAASVLSTAVMLVEQPLDTVLDVQAVAGAAGDEAFRRYMTSYVGDGKAFVSASLWQRRGDGVVPRAATGVTPAQSPAAPETRAFVRQAFGSSGPVARRLEAGGRTLLAWAQADRDSGYAVYAERALPANRRSSVDSDSAYADLHYAIYLGPRVTPDALTTTDVAPSALPLRGNTARVTVPFGDTVLTIISTPRHHLGSALSEWLPLGLLLGGLVLTAVAASTAHRFARGRWDAEHDAKTITDLFDEVERLYGQQRDLFVRLQHALLPQAHPAIAGLEIGSRYAAGARGIEIGGDWYSVVALDDHRFGFVIGDVSGRGVDTVAVMAHARFTIRAYLLDGQNPATALEKCSHQFDIESDGHLITVLVGIGDSRTGEFTLADAGHPVPLLVADGEVRPVQVAPGRPLGTGPARYRETTVRLAPGSTLFCFTDGLVERRGEDIDTGLGRLASTLRAASDTPIDDLVSRTVDALRRDNASDDIAALALRWTGA